MREKHIFWLLLVFIVYMHFEDLVKLYFNYHPIAHGFKYVFALVFFLIWIFQIGVVNTRFTIPLAVYLFFVFVQFINPLMFGKQGFMLSVIGSLYYIAFVPLFFVAHRVFDIERLKKTLWIVLGLACFSALAAHIQFFLGWQRYLQLMPYSHEMFLRTKNFVFHGPLAFSVKPPRYWYVAGIMISSIFVLSEKKKLIAGFLGLNCLLALALSGMRFAMAASFFSLMIVFFFGLRKQKISNAMRIAAVLILLLTMFFPFSMLPKQRYIQFITNPVGTYIQQRGRMWPQFFRDIVKYPLGTGLRAGGHIDTERFKVPDVSMRAGENYIAVIASQIGIFGLIAVLWLYVAIARKFYENLSLRRFRYFVSLGIFALLFSFMFEVGFFPGEGPSYWMFWLFSGVLFKIDKMEVQKMRKTYSLASESFFLRGIPDVRVWLLQSKFVKLGHRIFCCFRNSRFFRFIENIVKYAEI